MIPILTPEEAAQLDRDSADRGITTGALMERAGGAAARAAMLLTGGEYGRRAVVVVGKGSNGGDGLVAARHLHRRGVGVSVILLADAGSLSGAAATNLRRHLRAGGGLLRPGPGVLARELGRADVVIDAIFGTGFRGRPEGDHATAIDAINASGLPVVAVDVPSGVDAASGAAPGSAVRATATVTFGALKPGLVFHPGAALAGVVSVVDIGFPPELVRSDANLVDGSDVRELLPRRTDDTHKRSAGVVLVVAGSRAMTGAAVLVAAAATRAGAGLVTLAVPEGVLPVVEAAITQTTFLPLPETADGTVARTAMTALEERLQGAGALALGPGLTTNPETAEVVRRLVASSPAPVILDADGLNAFASRPAELSGHAADLVLTPHAGEFARLTGVSAADLPQDRIGHARKAAAEFGAVVLLKGSRTVVAEPGGRVRVNSTGGSYLATAGTGDVLTGTIAALVASGAQAADGAIAGAFVHGVAGRLAAESSGGPIVAPDVADRLPEAIGSVLA